MGHLDTEDQTVLLTLTYCPDQNIEIGSTLDTELNILMGPEKTDNLKLDTSILWIKLPLEK